MQVVEHEIKRYDSLSEEVEKKKKRGNYSYMHHTCNYLEVSCMLMLQLKWTLIMLRLRRTPNEAEKSW